MDITTPEINYTFPRQQISLISKLSINNSRILNLSISRASVFKKIFTRLREKVAIFSENEITEEIKKVREENLKK